MPRACKEPMRDMNMLAAEKWVRVMADYSSDGLWHKDGCTAAAEDLPISAPLQARLRAWCDWYEQNTDYLPADERKPFDTPAFAAEGREIARAIKAELPEWTVIYLDEAELEAVIAQRFDPSGGETDRQHFEREIS